MFTNPPARPIVHQFPCLKDNYGFLLHDPSTGETASIDTPDPAAILSEASARGWRITQIWNTHWHPDHAGGNAAVREATGCAIYGPKGEADRIETLDTCVEEGDVIRLGNITARVLDTPGHTSGHVVYIVDSANLAFVGDTLFALGCGRLFEGTPGQMWTSLQKLKALPGETLIYCAHEYTAANAAFALSVDPDNSDLQAYASEIRDQRSQGRPTVPTRLDREKNTNPFLRADEERLQTAVGRPGDEIGTFAEIRERKNRF